MPPRRWHAVATPEEAAGWVVAGAPRGLGVDVVGLGVAVASEAAATVVACQAVS